MTKTYVDFRDLTAEQKSDAVALHRDWKSGEFKDHSFVITKAGRVSRSPGAWGWTELAAKRMHDEAVAGLRGDDVRSKTDLKDFKTADFSLDRSPPLRRAP